MTHQSALEKRAIAEFAAATNMGVEEVERMASTLRAAIAPRVDVAVAAVRLAEVTRRLGDEPSHKKGKP